MEKSFVSKVFLVVLIGVLILLLRLFWAYISAIILALLIASAFYPLYSRVKRLLKGEERGASLLMTVFIFSGFGIRTYIAYEGVTGIAQPFFINPQELFISCAVGLMAEIAVFHYGLFMHKIFHQHLGFVAALPKAETESFRPVALPGCH